MPYLDVLFPEAISAECSIQPLFNNVVTRSHSGKRAVQINWDLPLRRWNVSHVVSHRERLKEFLDFWMTVRGTAYSFKFWDPSDYEVGVTYVNDVLVYSNPHLIGTGTGVQTQFQLVKLYGLAANPMSRKITKPIASTVKIYVNDVEKTTGVAINETTGIVTLTPAPPNGQSVKWAGHFYCEGSFESNEPVFQLNNPQVGEWTGISILEERGE